MSFRASLPSDSPHADQRRAAAGTTAQAHAAEGEAGSAAEPADEWSQPLRHLVWPNAVQRGALAPPGAVTHATFAAREGAFAVHVPRSRSGPAHVPEVSAHAGRRCTLCAYSLCAYSSTDYV